MMMTYTPVLLFSWPQSIFEALDIVEIDLIGVEKGVLCMLKA